MSTKNHGVLKDLNKQEPYLVATSHVGIWYHQQESVNRKS